MVSTGAWLGETPAATTTWARRPSEAAFSRRLVMDSREEMSHTLSSVSKPASRMSRAAAAKLSGLLSAR